VSSLDGPIGDQPRSVPRLGTPRDDDRLDIPYQTIGTGFGGSVDTKVIDAVER
jgi:hypothetical protein